MITALLTRPPCLSSVLGEVRPCPGLGEEGQESTPAHVEARRSHTVEVADEVVAPKYVDGDGGSDLRVCALGLIGFPVTDTSILDRDLRGVGVVCVTVRGRITRRTEQGMSILKEVDLGRGTSGVGPLTGGVPAPPPLR